MLIRYTWPSVLWSIFILFLTLIPGQDLPEVKIFQVDKLAHCFVFAVLMVLSSYGLKRFSDIRGIPPNPVLLTTLYCIVFGVMIEVLQQLIPERRFSYGDMLANNVGVGLGYLGFIIIRKKNSNKAT